MNATQNQRLTIICHDAPYPPHHGARVDMWRRIQALSELGATLQVIAWWCDPGSSEPTRRALAEYAEDVVLLPIRRDRLSQLRKAFLLARYPLEEAARWMPADVLAGQIQRVRDFAPQAIFQDGLHASRLAARLCKALSLPLLYRSHNVEHVYIKRLRASARGVHKLRRFLSTLHLERLERNVMARAAVVYDISLTDMAYWQDQGISRVRWLPPLVQLPDAASAPAAPIYDVVLIGNLSMENNLRGLEWFIQQVLPRLRSDYGDIRFLVAGSNPHPAAVALCEQTPGVTLIANPESVVDLYRQSRACINPVLSGSGIKIKTLEMLSMGMPFVSTTEGASGLPREMRDSMNIADDPAIFAAKLAELLRSDRPDVPDPQRMREHFGPEANRVILDDLAALSG